MKFCKQNTAIGKECETRSDDENSTDLDADTLMSSDFVFESDDSSESPLTEEDQISNSITIFAEFQIKLSAEDSFLLWLIIRILIPCLRKIATFAINFFKVWFPTIVSLMGRNGKQAFSTRTTKERHKMSFRRPVPTPQEHYQDKKFFRFRLKNTDWIEDTDLFNLAFLKNWFLTGKSKAHCKKMDGKDKFQAVESKLLANKVFYKEDSEAWCEYFQKTSSHFIPENLIANVFMLSANELQNIKSNKGTLQTDQEDAKQDHEERSIACKTPLESLWLNRLPTDDDDDGKDVQELERRNLNGLAIQSKTHDESETNTYMPALKMNPSTLQLLNLLNEMKFPVETLVINLTKEEFQESPDKFQAGGIRNIFSENDVTFHDILKQFITNDEEVKNILHFLQNENGALNNVQKINAYNSYNPFNRFVVVGSREDLKPFLSRVKENGVSDHCGIAFKDTLMDDIARTSKSFRQNHQYKVVGELGKGAFGQVLLCISVERNELFAMKRIKRQYFREEEVTIPALQLQGYAKALKIYGIVVEDEFINIIMEYAEGGSLKKRRYTTRNTFLESVSIFFQLLKALKELHGHGIAHFDIKEDNVALKERNPILLFSLTGDLQNALEKFTASTTALEEGAIIKEELRLLENSLHSLVPTLKDLFKQMLDPDVTKRITVSAAMQHGVFKSL